MAIGGRQAHPTELKNHHEKINIKKEDLLSDLLLQQQPIKRLLKTEVTKLKI